MACSAIAGAAQTLLARPCERLIARAADAWLGRTSGRLAALGRAREEVDAGIKCSAATRSPRRAQRLTPSCPRKTGSIPRYGLLLPFHRGVALRHKGLDVAVVEGPQEAADDIHILLRHRLLPQPGGFEGITHVVELANAHDQPVPDRE
jgi:hypothetical protein